MLADTEAQIVITDAERLPTVREAVAGLPHVRQILVQGGVDDPQATPAELQLDALLEVRAARRPIASIDSRRRGRDALLVRHDRPAQGGAAVARQLAGQRRGRGDAAELDRWEGPRITLSAMPIAHIFGVAIMNDLLMTPDHLADQTRLMQMRWFEPERFMALIQEHRCTATAAVPTILAVLLHHPLAAKYDLSSLSEIICGGAPLPVELAQAFMRRYPCPHSRSLRPDRGYRAGHGQSPHRAVSARLGRPGVLQYGTADCRRRRSTAAGRQRGEICLRGPIVMQGYHNRPDETAQTIRGGWLHTGDIGYLDDDGYLFVVDRKKDMIIRGGENIYPAELEAVLHEHPARGRGGRGRRARRGVWRKRRGVRRRQAGRDGQRDGSDRARLPRRWRGSRHRRRCTFCRRCRRATSARSSAACCAKKRPTA